VVFQEQVKKEAALPLYC